MSPRTRWPYRRRARIGEPLPPDFVEPPLPDPTLELPLPPVGPGQPVEEPHASRAPWPWLLLFGLLVIGGLVIAWALTRGDGHGSTTTTVVVSRSVRVPGVVGFQERAAVEQIADAGLRARVNRRPGNRPAGVVLSQLPPAGRTIASGSVVELGVSTGRQGAATVRVPDVVGKTRAQATRALSDAGLRPDTAEVFSRKAVGTVVGQSPQAGEEVIQRSIVRLTVSKGERRLVVPDVVGQSEAAARDALRSAHLLASVFHVPSKQPAGTVVAQDPKAGTRIAPRAKVRINVSRGAPAPPRTTTVVTVRTATTVTASTTTASRPTTTRPAPPPTPTVPDVVGERLAAARRALRARGLLAAVVYIASRQPADTVIAQFPKPGRTVARNARVRINIALGPSPKPQRAIPDVTGLDEAAAAQQLERAGFTVDSFDRDTDDPSEDGVVLDQDPAAGSQAPRGSSVTIYVGRYPGG